jgi:hypothetical protein
VAERYISICEMREYKNISKERLLYKEKNPNILNVYMP